MKFEMTEKELKVYEKIQTYVSGALSDTDRIAFEKEMQNNSQLAQEVSIYKNLIPVIVPNVTGEDKLRASLQEIHRTKQKGSATTKTFTLKKWYLPVAASLLLLVGMLKFLPSNGTGNNMDQFFQYDQIALVSKSAQDPSYGELERAFNAGDYKTSLTLADKVLSLDADNPEVLLAKGIAQMETGDYNAALSSFKTLKEAQLRIDKSDWYTALTQIKMGDKKSAAQTLENLISTEGYNYNRAKELLKEIQ